MEFLKDQVILITGGTGSFGRNFVKFLLENTEAKKIIVFSRDELKQFYMAKEFTDPRMRYFLGDVRDLQRLERAFHGVDIVVHAAALKQVPMLEYNPFEAVKTNIIGSQNVIEAAINQNVKSVLLVSTDKAAEPINLYGSTKLCAERLFISGNYYSSCRTRFSCVRYGNVIGSRGSVIETLLNNPDTKKVTITDENMTRFWITLDQAMLLVIFALKNMVGGEVFVPKIPSMKIGELFNVLAPNAEREIIGIRPGEKIHEVLLTEHESIRGYDLGEYFVILPNLNSMDKYDQHISRGNKLADDYKYRSVDNSDWLDTEKLKELLKL